MKRFLVAKFLAWIFIFFIFYSAQGEKFSWDSTSRQTVYENIFHFSFYYFISLNLIAHAVFFFARSGVYGNNCQLYWLIYEIYTFNGL